LAFEGFSLPCPRHSPGSAQAGGIPFGPENAEREKRAPRVPARDSPDNGGPPEQGNPHPARRRTCPMEVEGRHPCLHTGLPNGPPGPGRREVSLAPRRAGRPPGSAGLACLVGVRASGNGLGPWTIRRAGQHPGSFRPFGQKPPASGIPGRLHRIAAVFQSADPAKHGPYRSRRNLRSQGGKDPPSGRILPRFDPGLPLRTRGNCLAGGPLQVGLGRVKGRNRPGGASRVGRSLPSAFPFSPSPPQGFDRAGFRENRPRPHSFLPRASAGAFRSSRRMEQPWDVGYRSHDGLLPCETAYRARHRGEGSRTGFRVHQPIGKSRGRFGSGHQRNFCGPADRRGSLAAPRMERTAYCRGMGRARGLRNRPVRRPRKCTERPLGKAGIRRDRICGGAASSRASLGKSPPTLRRAGPNRHPIRSNPSIGKKAWRGSAARCTKLPSNYSRPMRFAKFHPVSPFQGTDLFPPRPRSRSPSPRRRTS